MEDFHTRLREECPQVIPFMNLCLARITIGCRIKYIDWVYQLNKADTRYTLYHDETNNIGRLHIGPRGLNVENLPAFVLGGVVHEGDPYPIDITPLRHAMRIHQQSAGEIKLKHVARGGFLELLESTKLTTFLRWIRNNGLMIHYQELDPLYWSIVDIIDSIVGNMGNSILALHHADLKSNLTAVLRRNLDATIRVFHQHG